MTPFDVKTFLIYGHSENIGLNRVTHIDTIDLILHNVQIAENYTDKSRKRNCPIHRKNVVIFLREVIQ